MNRPALSCLCAAGLLLAPALAFANPIATFSCTSGQNTASANLSYYNLGITAPTTIGSGTSGAGAGKVTFQPLSIHVALSQFGSFFPLATSAAVLPTCILTSSVSGSNFKVEFKTVIVQSVTAIASKAGTYNGVTADPIAYVDVELVYASIAVDSNGSDDGGTSPASGWNRVTNTSDGNTAPPIS